MKKYLFANWKMNKNVKEAKEFTNALEKNDQEENEIVICPSSIALQSLNEFKKEKNIKLASQNISSKEEGALTGELAATQVKEFCEYVICGHSERRYYFGESDKLIGEKVRMVLKEDMIPVICVGETLAEKKIGQTEEVVGSQLDIIFKDVSEQDQEKFLIVYEPRWAISTAADNFGEADTPANAEAVAKIIKKKYPKTTVIYGGSVDPNNIENFLKMPNISGALVGGASLEVGKFNSMTKLL
ncbi:MAG: triose-phosphate isomerase [bacterium]